MAPTGCSGPIRVLSALAFPLALAACGGGGTGADAGGTDAPDEEVSVTATSAAANATAATGAATPAADTALLADAAPATTAPAADADTGDRFGPSVSAIIEPIPYPLYPHGERYRVGGENGLRIVLFETADEFGEVDAWYRAQRETSTMPRLAAMSDYVRYARDPDDTDAWGTHRPGIVIHGFADDAERDAVGADPASRTNIIVSY